MKRLTTIEAKLPLYRSQNVQVLGISVDDPVGAAKWAKEIGITFPLLADKDGQVSQRFGLYDSKTQRSAKALAVVHNNQIVYSEEVSTAEVPPRLLPWVENLLNPSG